PSTFLFFSPYPPTPPPYTLSLHDALPIYRFDEADELLFKNVRAIFGGRVRHATSGAAPIAKEILEFFYACGVPVFEGYGMTETADRKSTRLNSSHVAISYAVFCLKKKKKT